MAHKMDLGPKKALKRIRCLDPVPYGNVCNWNIAIKASRSFKSIFMWAERRAGVSRFQWTISNAYPGYPMDEIVGGAVDLHGSFVEVYHSTSLHVVNIVVGLLLFYKSRSEIASNVTLQTVWLRK